MTGVFAVRHELAFVDKELPIQTKACNLIIPITETSINLSEHFLRKKLNSINVAERKTT